MKTMKAGYEILTDLTNKYDILRKIELAGRTCYKSEDKMTDDSAKKFVEARVKTGHLAILEFFDVTVKFIVDRGVSHELVRHRLCDFAQESTRFCNYGKDGEVKFITPCMFEPESDKMYAWIAAMEKAEYTYMHMLELGCSPQEARSVLPNSVKTEVVMKANLREWRHILSLRACGTTGKPHPQMLEVMIPLLLDLKVLLPEVFGDLIIPVEYMREYGYLDEQCYLAGRLS